MYLIIYRINKAEKLWISVYILFKKYLSFLNSSSIYFVVFVFYLYLYLIIIIKFMVKV